MKKTLYVLMINVLAGCFFAGDIIAQEVKISAELRPRYEMRHGYKTLIPDDMKAANFISQRTRLNAFYGNENFKFFLSLQDVRVWGDVPQLNTKDVNGTSIHEAWGEAIICDKFSVKVGRQEIIYDDHRMFGSVGWAQQARSHDAAIIKYKPGKNHKIDVGLAYNANGESLYKEDYYVNNYRTFQYAWYHGNFNEKIGLSFLILNNGLAYTDNSDSVNIQQKVAFSQTFGPRFTFKNDLLNLNLASYMQVGKNGKNEDLTSRYFAADVAFKVSELFDIGLGFEYLSGTDSDLQTNDDRSFTPFYGTNHKFNGWMDYFYVGTHNGNVGLTDFFLPINFKKDKFSVALIPHYFSSAAKVSQQQADGTWKEYDNGLGTEIDLMVGYAVSDAVNLQAGYSQMFATETMQVLKGGNYENNNNWAWVMITFKPTFFEKK